MKKIADIKNGDKNFDVEGTITSKKMSPEGASKKWARCVFEDKFDEIVLWLWGEDADAFNIGDVVVIKKAYARVNPQNNELSLSKSQFGGTIEKKVA